MKTSIVIMVDCENRNLIYPATIATVKGEIRSYFGTKNCFTDVPELPIVRVACEVTQPDINALKEIIDNESIYLTAIIGADESERVKGDIISLI
jgi:hypothetical protein